MAAHRPGLCTGSDLGEALRPQGKKRLRGGQLRCIQRMRKVAHDLPRVALALGKAVIDFLEQLQNLHRLILVLLIAWLRLEGLVLLVVESIVLPTSPGFLQGSWLLVGADQPLQILKPLLLCLEVVPGLLFPFFQVIHVLALLRADACDQLIEMDLERVTFPFLHPG